MAGLANLRDKEASSWFQVSHQGNVAILSVLGEWRITNSESIDKAISRFWKFSPNQKLFIDGSRLESIDTAGAMLLCCALQAQGIELKVESFSDFDSDHLAIVSIVLERYSRAAVHEALGEKRSILRHVGKATFDLFKKMGDIFNFVGLTHVEFARALTWPKNLRFKELFVQLEQVCVNAIPIAALVTFLIGIVIAYLFAIQIEKYGANIFIVDAVGVAMCRELSPIIVAIIVAGRSGSAFTAQIGTMKLNEELDALRTLGLSPMQVLVVPRVLALVIAMPLLVFIGDIVGIFGAGIIADFRLGITPTTFIERLNIVLPVKSLLVGLIKAPVFAVFIAVIGCRMGLAVEMNARSLGLSTTSTVVQSIVSVILLNAAFAIIFVELGI